MTKKERIEAVLNEAPYVMTDADKKEFVQSMATVLKAVRATTDAVGTLNEVFDERDSREVRHFNIFMGEKINKLESDFFDYLTTYAENNPSFDISDFAEAMKD